MKKIGGRLLLRSFNGIDGQLRVFLCYRATYVEVPPLNISTVGSNVGSYFWKCYYSIENAIAL